MIQSISNAVASLDEDQTLELVRFHLDNGVSSKEILESVQQGMEQVGMLYEKQAFFLADLIMAGIIFKEVLKLDEMQLSIQKKIKNGFKPVILIGTVRGDLHDIGKDIFSGMAISAGYEIIDIGVDVSAEKFILAYQQHNPDIIALSGVLSESLQQMKKTIGLFRQTDLAKQVYIIVGGRAVNKDNYTVTGADAYSSEIKAGLETCDAWIQQKYGDFR